MCTVSGCLGCLDARAALLKRDGLEHLLLEASRLDGCGLRLGEDVLENLPDAR